MHTTCTIVHVYLLPSFVKVGLTIKRNFKWICIDLWMDLLDDGGYTQHIFFSKVGKNQVFAAHDPSVPSRHVSLHT